MYVSGALLVQGFFFAGITGDWFPSISRLQMEIDIRPLERIINEKALINQSFLSQSELIAQNICTSVDPADRRTVRASGGAVTTGHLAPPLPRDRRVSNGTVSRGHRSVVMASFP